VEVVAARSGPLAGPLRELGVRVRTASPATGRSVPDAVAAALSQSGAGGASDAVRRGQLRVLRRGAPAPDVVVVQGAGGLPLLDLLTGGDPRRLGAPLVVHLHELRTGLSRSASPDVVRRWLRASRTVLAVSAPVAELATAAGAPAARIRIVPGPTDPAPPRPREAARAALARLDIAAADVRRWVGGAGTPGWRKGTDRIGALGCELARTAPDAAVAWVGGRPAGADAAWAEAPDPVRWVDARPDPWVLLAGVDVVVVPSREDPLPLVALEAGQHGLPVVGTPHGGLRDLLADGRGVLVDGHDLLELSRAVLGLLEDPDAAAAAAARLRDHVEAHHAADVVVPAWWEAVTGG
jgi:glycosyltransferase involved in cell wall biosynthesis